MPNPSSSSRRAIGVLVAIVHQPFWLGTVDGAQQRDVDLVCFVGGVISTAVQPLIRSPLAHVLPARAFFDLAKGPRIDGLITWGGSRAGFGVNLNETEMEEFIAPYRYLPIINYEGIIKGIPSVLTDTYRGMCDLISHMIEVHRRRRIALIRGPARHLESEERFRAYQDTLRRYGIPFDPALVVHASNWGKTVGVQAVHTLIRERGRRPVTDVDAIIGSEIDYAVGALQTLEEYGVRVPDDIAVAGFNDHLDAQTLNVPITVMAKPFYEAGVVAVHALLDLIEGKVVPDRIDVPARLIVRRSCGCWSLDPVAPHLISDAAINSVAQGSPLSDQETRLVEQIGRVRESARGGVSHVSWIDALIRGMRSTDPIQNNRERDRFWRLFETELASTRDPLELDRWYDVLSELFFLVTSALKHTDQLSQTNRPFLQRVHLALMQERERARIERRARTVENTHTLLEISHAMMLTRSIEQLFEILVYRLPELGITDCNLVLFDNFYDIAREPEFPEWARVVLAMRDGKRLSLSPEGIRFPSRQILPDTWLEEPQSRALIVNPLFFGARYFGYIAARIGTRDGKAYLMLAQQMSSALQSVFLWRDYHESEYARRESEARMHTLIEHIPVALWAKDRTGRYIMQNSVMRTLVKDRDQDDGSGVDHVIVQWKTCEAWAFEGKTVSFEHTIFVRQQVRLFRHIMAPVRVDGQVTAILGLMFDITEQRAIEESLRSAKEAAEEARRTAEAANRAKSIFLSNISHELRTPLNSILGYTQILQADQLINDHQRKGLHIIQASGEHLLSLINDLLDLAKVEAGKMQFQVTIFDIYAMITEICDMIEERAAIKNLKFLREISGVPRMVLGDERRLRQVLVNLLSNAVKFTRQGSVALRVMGSPDAQTRIRFQVSDTGAGIAPEHLEIIFKPFEQLGAQTGEQGSGLGLAISRELVALMGGTLQVQSEPGRGSVFWFDIPLPAVDREPFPAVQSRGRVIGVDGQSPTVLVVDDHADNRVIVRDMLQPLGFIVAEACDGLEGLAQIEAFKPDVVILDLVMPALNGLDMIRRIRQMTGHDHLVVIVSSASAYPDDRIQSLNAGAQAFIPKPISRSLLVETLQRHIPWIEWRYDKPLPDVQSDHSDALPPETTLTVLSDLAQIGDVDALHDAIDRLKQDMPQVVSFIGKVQYFLDTFQIGQLQTFLEQMRARR
jgi:signal transduction histidine kinase/DNA-binding LacI/PurR family transcriptional regulator/DNA-binding LytR/AlgR family response regulator